MKSQKIVALLVAIAMSSAGFAKEVVTRAAPIPVQQSFESQVFDLDGKQNLSAVELTPTEMQETQGEFFPIVAGIALGAAAIGMWLKHTESKVTTGDWASSKEVAKAGAIDGGLALVPGGAVVSTAKKAKTAVTVGKAVTTTNKVTTATKTTNVATKSGSLNTLKSVLNKAEPFGNRPNQVSTVLDDGTRVIFRKDFGEQAHPLKRKLFGNKDINHYNIEIKQPPKQIGQKEKVIQDFHILPQPNGNHIMYDKSWRQIGVGIKRKK
ncbi:MAG: hypothetical protein J6M43_03075 [Neisseriaceae bacterium]|nr:hypothetical protein [Neisseriaceae bacterium]